jgi:hypothetical protein
MSALALQHAPHPPSGWASLGLWTEGADDAPAAEALARRVATAARLKPGDRVLSISCGHGTELALWRDAFAGREIVGLEQEGLAAAEAEQAMQHRALGGSVQGLLGSLDAIACRQDRDSIASCASTRRTTFHRDCPSRVPLCRPCGLAARRRRQGLGYALFSARAPLGPAAPSAGRRGG